VESAITAHVSTKPLDKASEASFPGLRYETDGFNVKLTYPPYPVNA